MGTADYNVIEMGKARARIERSLDNGERFADLKGELAHDMRRALSGHQGWVTTTVTAQGLSRHVETLQSAPEAVAVALQDDAAQAALRDVLDASRCLLVAALRQRITAHIYRNLGDSVLDALDNMHNAACLMQVLRTSPCIHVAKLRDAIVAAYVDGNAERVSEARIVR